MIEDRRQPSASTSRRPTKLRTSDRRRSGPAISSSRGRQRSARCPKPICETDADSWNSIVSVPAAASDRSEPWDQQRQQRREDVAVAVHDEVRRTPRSSTVGWSRRRDASSGDQRRRGPHAAEDARGRVGEFLDPQQACRDDERRRARRRWRSRRAAPAQHFAGSGQQRVEPCRCDAPPRSPSRPTTLVTLTMGTTRRWLSRRPSRWRSTQTSAAPFADGRD